MANVVAYYRVSTARQGRSGLGLDAQRAAVAAYLNGGQLVGEFQEVETGRGSNALEKRPQLRAALDLCKRRRATLVIAKLDRLARNVHFISGLMEAGVDFVAADMPNANKTMLQIYAAMAEWERDQISKRTKDALAAAKARGVKLGTAGAANIQPVNDARRRKADEHARTLRPLLAKLAGLSQRKMVAELNRLGVAAPRGGKWHRQTVLRVLARAAFSKGPRTR